MAKACGSSESSHVEQPLERSIHTLAITKSGFQSSMIYARTHHLTSWFRLSAAPLSHLFVFASFQYLTPERIRIFPRVLTGTPLARPTALHFICSPTRAAIIMSQVAEVEGWSPVSIYE